MRNIPGILDTIILAAIIVATGCRTHAIRLPETTFEDPTAQELTLPAEFIDGWIVVEARINGQGPFRMVLDTGAGLSGISHEVAQALALEEQARVKLVDIAGQTRMYPFTYADLIQVGELRLEPVPLIMTDVFDHFGDDLNIQGLLGYIGLDAYTLDLDYPAQKVRVSKAPLTEADGNIVPLKRLPFDTPHIEVSLLNDDEVLVHTEWFGIDTGGEMMMNIPKAQSDDWAHRDLARTVLHGTSLSGTPTTEPTGPLRGPLAIGQVTIDRAVADLDASSPLLGHQFLRQFRLRLDPRSAGATLTLPNPMQTRITATQFGGIGINAKLHHNDQLVLFKIAADSPAVRAGLLPNDKVIAIDGIAVSDPHFIDLTAWMFDPPAQVTLTIRRKADEFEVTIPTEPLFPEDLDRLRNARPDLQPPPAQLITKPDGTMELVFPDGTRGLMTPVPPP